MKPSWDSFRIVHECMQSSRTGTMNLIVKFTRITRLKYEMLRNADYLITNGNVEGFEIVNKLMRYISAAILAEAALRSTE